VTAVTTRAIPTRALLDPSTAIRSGLATAGAGIVAVSLASTLGPTIVDLAGDTGAGVTAMVIGMLLRVMAGGYAGRWAGARGAGTGTVALSCAAGGGAGYLFFPGLVGVLGLVVTDAGPGSYLRLLAAGLVAATACALGGVVACRRARGRADRGALGVEVAASFPP
jgi:hypothetical protein